MKSLRIAVVLLGLTLGLVPQSWAGAEFQEFILHNATASSTGGAVMPVTKYTSVALDVTVTATATVTFEGSVSGGAWTAISCTNAATGSSSTTTTATGVFQCNVAGMSAFRAEVTWTSGTVTAFARATTAPVTSAGGGGLLTSILAILTDVWDTVNRAFQFTMVTLLSGEDQTNNLLMTSGGAVRSTAMMAAVSTNTTGSPVALPTGNKTIKGTLTCNAGGSTNCGITVTIYGSELNTQATGTEEQLCQMVIPTGAAVTTRTCPPISAAFLYIWSVTTGVAGTSPSLNVTSMY